MEETVSYLLTHYEEICEKMSDAIRASGRGHKYFYLELGISRATFDRRLRQNDWKPAELGRLMKMVDREVIPVKRRRRKRWLGMLSF